jgi:beta-N-acetylhexosaminidase
VTEWADLVGERLVIGLPGPDLRDEDVALFRDTRAGGIMLYRRNYETPERLARLIDGLESALGRRILVTTDHEGGRIIMLGAGTTVFPDNLAIGTAGEEAFAARQGAIEARELRRLGVDVNFGPCLDVLTDRYSPNIGIRSYGKDPDVVTRYGTARLTGMQRGGVSACPKHFPGKGHSPLDAHLKLPTIDSTWADMHATHLPPFLAAIAAGADCVMTSHPVYPNLDPSGVPATFSRLIVEEYLRGEVGFRGVIISDDLDMGAVSETTTIDDAIVRTAAAGHDLLLICHREASQRAAATALTEAYRSGALPRRELEAAVARVRRLHDKRPARRDGGAAAPEPDGITIAKAAATRAVTFVTSPPPGFLKALNGRVAAIFPRFSDLAPRIFIEPVIQNEAGFLKNAFAPVGIAPEALIVGMEPTAEEIDRAATAAAGADATVLFLFDAHLYASNRALLEAVQRRARALAVVLLRDPYDAALLAPGVLGVTAFGFRACQLEAVIARLTMP